VNNRMRTILISVIAAVWAINYTAPIFVHTYAPPGEIHVVFMALIAGLLPGYKRNDNDDDKPRRQDEGMKK
jgi:1,4-dihydroxy-2-naphthoate octaprenyltransferase